MPVGERLVCLDPQKRFLKCPNCGHQHFRIVKNGVITGERWGQDPSQNLPTFVVPATVTTCSTSAVYTTGANTTANFIYNSWLNVGTGTSTIC